MQPIVIVLYALTFTTGLVNAVTILGLGDIFASVMTGNVVFAGLWLGGASRLTPIRPLVAIAAFIFGGLIAGRLAFLHKSKSVGRRMLAMALIETALLLAAALIGYFYIPLGHEEPMKPAVLTAIFCIAMAMGLRNATINDLQVADLKTTVLTLTMASIGADEGAGKHKTASQLRRLTSIVVLGAGAVAGAELYYRAGIFLPLLVMAVIVLSSALVFSRSKEGREKTSEEISKH